MSLGYEHIHSRFTDLRNEPVRILTPIKGLQQLPLVSLNEAVKPVSSFFYSLADYVYVAKENCKNPKDGLTQDESASIYLYTMEFDPPPSLYKVLNSVLRSEERGGLQPWRLYLKLLFTALHKLPSQKLTIWRGVREVDLSSQYEIGMSVVWWGVSSCTRAMEVLQNVNFLGKHGRRTMCCIESENGKQITSHSYFKDKEQEIILMPGTFLRVESKANPADDLHIIHLKEMPPPISFVEAPSESVTAWKVPVKPSVYQETPKNASNSHGNMQKVVPISHDPKPVSQPNYAEQPVYIKPALEPTQVENAESPLPVSQNLHSPHNRSKIRQERWSATAIATVVVLICFTFLPIAALVVGLIHKDNCPAQTWIPRWMIIFGAVGLATFGVVIIIALVTILNCPKDNRSTGYGLSGCLLCLLGFFFLAWLIMGSVWVFPYYRKIQSGNISITNYCSDSLYKFTFGTLLAQYSLIGLLVCCGGCLGLLLCLH